MKNKFIKRSLLNCLLALSVISIGQTKANTEWNK